MTTFFTEVRQTLVPRGEVKHGPLPPLLVAMTLITGLVDAFSYLVLGHVFVANMTGNVVFLAIVGISADSHLVGGSGSRAGRRLIAVAAMLVGALVGSLLIFHVSIVSPLVVALIVMASIAGTTRVLSRTDPAWVRAS